MQLHPLGDFLTLVDLGNGTILQMPDFIHDYGPDNDSMNPLCHYYRGSLIRHISVEKSLLFLRRKILGELIGDAFPLYEFLDSIVGIALGFNCNFPAGDIALYTVWRLKGCKPIAVFKEK